MKNLNKLQKMCEHISSREILASRAERDSVKYKQAEYLQDKIGQIFEGVVSGVTDWGLYVEIIENKCEGMIRYNGRFKVDSENYTIQRTTGEVIRLGDTVQILVLAVDLEQKKIDFDIL